MIKQYKKVLTIAGSDSGGGAGIQADLKTISACGCYGLSVITAITAQNTKEISEVYPIPISIINAQLRAVLEDIGADAVKTGILFSSEIINSVCDILSAYPLKNLVVDPVMISTSGFTVLQEEALDTLKTRLFPIARIITPNIPEAEILLKKKISINDDLQLIAKELSELGNTSVLLKSAHLPADSLTDIFYNAETFEIIEIKNPLIQTNNTHGSGCTLSSAIASFLALGYALNEAVIQASQYVHNAILAASEYQLGEGHGPLQHFYKFWI